ncbi:MAG: ImmA/IrrE family metallo-endopeptidase [Deltaproteobacteria bacterium]|nr:ImmA/IrrE family metallo-endopeptidase [Deltaproteobacteria bacterium]
MLRTVGARQAELRDLLVEGGATALEFIGRVKPSISVESLADELRRFVPIGSQSQREYRSADALFRVLRQAVESTGIFVYLEGDLGSHHSRLDPSIFRGLALKDTIAPVIVLNPNDSKGALCFSLLHEVAHLLLGDEGLSNYAPFDERRPRNNSVERLCNGAAGEFLLPSSEVASYWDALEESSLESRVSRLAREFSVSHTAAAYRLLRLGRIDAPTFRRLRALYHRRASQRAAALKKQDGGPGYLRLQRYRLGEATLALVASAVAEGSLRSTRAARVLRVAPTHVADLCEARG